MSASHTPDTTPGREPGPLQRPSWSDDKDPLEATGCAPAARRPVRISFDNTYARLPGRFYARLDPTPVAAPRLVRVNAALADSLGLDPDALASPEGVEVLAGSRVPEGAEPIALAYAGHQSR